MTGIRNGLLAKVSSTWASITSAHPVVPSFFTQIFKCLLFLLQLQGQQQSGQALCCFVI